MRTLISITIILSTGISFAADLPGNFNLAGTRSTEPQYFAMHSHYIKYSQAGERAGTEDYRLLLACQPGEAGETYTCRRFSITLRGNEKTIPALAGWSYLFQPHADGLGNGGPMFGISHDHFENLTTGDGQPVDTEHRYAIYNCFIDFHGFNNVFARPADEGAGIEDLHRIGDDIVHIAAFSEPPVNLGKGIKEGSVFRNGEIKLQLKGMSRIDGADCALVGFDSGASSFVMKIEAMPNMIVDTKGTSHYFGDIYLNLSTFWLKKADMAEFVVSETTIPSMNMQVPGIIERKVTVENVSKDEFEALLRGK